MATDSNIRIWLGTLVLAFSLSIASASYDQLVDFCVANLSLPVQANGFPCKNPEAVNADDFYFSGLNRTGSVWTTTGSALAWATVRQVPGLNSIGLSLVRAEYAVGGDFPFHVNHVSEIIFLLRGNLEVGFFTAYPDQQLLKKVLSAGDMFVFPQGLIHYQKNVGTVNATAIVALTGQNISPVIVASTLFGSHPIVGAELLAKDFRTDVVTVKRMLKNFDP